jgi:hypothetical protein
MNGNGPAWKRKRRTGSKTMHDYPTRAAKIIQMLALDYSNNVIRKKMNVDVRTLNAIRENYPREIEKQREAMRNITFPGMMMSAERCIEKIPTASVGQAAIAMGIFADKWDKLTGAPTQRIEVEHKFSFVEQITKLTEEAEQRAREIKEAQVIDVDYLPALPAPAAPDG